MSRSGPTRRTTLLVPIAVGLAAGLPVASRATPVRGARDPWRALPSFLDTLMPADESPSATQLGLDGAFRQLGRGRLKPVLDTACGWLDREARRRFGREFADLPQARRDVIVAFAAGAPPKSLPFRSFQFVHKVLIRLYYARPETWPSLGFDGPPQPAGFPDHADAPTTTR